MSVLVLAFANQENILLDNLQNSLRKYGYHYQIIGKGMKWENFMTKVKACYDYILQVKNYELVCIVDAFDMLACGSPKKLVRKFKRYHKDIVVGGENACGGNCTPLDAHFKYSDNEKGRYQYANGGFYIGYPKAVAHMLKYILDLGIEDDQIGIGKYMNKYPYNTCLDHNGSLISNVNITKSYYDTYWKDGKVTNVKTGAHPCFVHTPSIQYDFHIRMDYFGRRLLKDKYNEYSTMEKCKRFYSKYKTKVNKLAFFVFFIIIVVLVWFYM